MGTRAEAGQGYSTGPGTLQVLNKWEPLLNLQQGREWKSAHSKQPLGATKLEEPWRTEFVPDGRPDTREAVPALESLAEEVTRLGGPSPFPAHIPPTPALAVKGRSKTPAASQAPKAVGKGPHTAEMGVVATPGGRWICTDSDRVRARGAGGVVFIKNEPRQVAGAPAGGGPRA